MKMSEDEGQRGVAALCEALAVIVGDDPMRIAIATGWVLTQLKTKTEFAGDRVLNVAGASLLSRLGELIEEKILGLTDLMEEITDMKKGRPND